MSDELYRVVFVGEVEEGRDPAVVRSQLAALGLLNAEQAGHLQPGQSVVLETGLSRDQALHYENALKATGARCRVVASPGETQAPQIAAPPQPVLVDTDMDWSLGKSESLSLADTLELSSNAFDAPPAVDASAAVGQGMTCPKCGFEQPESEECQACGIFVSKFQKRETAGEAPWDDDALPEEAGQMYEGSMSGGPLHDTDPAKVRAASDDSYFAPEKRGIEKGMMGGIAMMVIAVVWFGAGWMAGIIFFYPPILFLFGLFAFFKGLLTGNIAGG